MWITLYLDACILVHGKFSANVTLVVRRILQNKEK